MVKSELNAEADADVEILWIQVNPHPRVQWIFGMCYRPKVDEDLMLAWIIKSINDIRNENMILPGDSNFRNIDWQTVACSKPIEQTFIDTINDNLLIQFVEEPTRGENILDLAFIAGTSQVLSCETLPSLRQTDHSIARLLTKLPVPRIASQPRKIFLYSKGDYDGMNEMVEQEDWDKTLRSKDIEANWTKYKGKYQEAIERFVPHKMTKAVQRLKLPWTRYKSVQKAKAKQRHQKVEALKSGLNADRILEREAKTETDNVILAAKAHYKNKIVEQSKDNLKRYWNYTRHYTRSSSTIDVIESGGTKYMEDQIKAQLFNNFFSSILTNEIPVDSPHLQTEGDEPRFILRDMHVTTDAVRKKLLKVKASTYWDNAPIWTSRSTLYWTSRSRRDAHRNTGGMQTSHPCSRKALEFHWPVSLTSQVVKILEMIIYDELMELATKNKTISYDQHCFQDKCSCVTQHLKCLNDWTSNYDEKKQTDVVYLDFAKAFNTVPHQRLLIKLKKHGVRGKVYRG